jgi:hypothetical protein
MNWGRGMGPGKRTLRILDIGMKVGGDGVMWEHGCAWAA